MLNPAGQEARTYGEELELPLPSIYPARYLKVRYPRKYGTEDAAGGKDLSDVYGRVSEQDAGGKDLDMYTHGQARPVCEKENRVWQTKTVPRGSLR